jgi:hypothetical protein
VAARALLNGGVVGGEWHQRRSGRKLAITVEPLRELIDEAELVGGLWK